MISIIVAIAENYAIGKNNDLLWHIPEDLKRFKRLTTGHSVIMGKKTYESLPRKPLPNRRNVIITDDPGDHFEQCVTVFSVEDVLKNIDHDEENFVIGGASVYRQFLPLSDRMYITWVHKPFDADVFFPEIDFSEWSLVSSEDVIPDGNNDFAYSNHIYERINKK
jgi:dihydrofolate reductase